MQLFALQLLVRVNILLTFHVYIFWFLSQNLEIKLQSYIFVGNSWVNNCIVWIVIQSYLIQIDDISIDR